MHKRKTICALGLSVALLLMVSAPALADDDITGFWTGNWNCQDTPEHPCIRPGGAMEGRLKQDGGKVTGSFTVHDTMKGTLSCQCQNGAMAGNRLTVNLDCGEVSAYINASVLDNSNLQGIFTSGEVNRSDFDIKR